MHRGNIKVESMPTRGKVRWNKVYYYAPRNTQNETEQVN
jgi:hypothetical protein